MGRSSFGKVTELMSSVMDLHVKIALQEASREKRRLIGGAVFLGMGITLATFAGVAAQIALLLWLHQSLAWSWLNCALVVAGLDLALSAPAVGEGEPQAEYLAPHPSQWQEV